MKTGKCIHGYDLNYPIILPKNRYFTELVAKHYH